MTVQPIARPRTGARRTLVRAIAAIPRYLRLLGGLIIDRRVALFDKLLLAAAIAYTIMPFDLIPDFIPVIGLADDVFLLTLAVRRLVSNAGMKVVLDHWTGAPEELSDAHLELTISAAAFFIPRRILRRLEKRLRR
jgi:uncharacterized membrane protein YkvA (DUF1232 family)